MKESNNLQTNPGRWIEEARDQEQAVRKYKGRCAKVQHGLDASRIVKVVDVEFYGGLIVPICETLKKLGTAKHCKFEKREAIHPGRLK